MQRYISKISIPVVMVSPLFIDSGNQHKILFQGTNLHPDSLFHNQHSSPSSPSSPHTEPILEETTSNPLDQTDSAATKQDKTLIDAERNGNLADDQEADSILEDPSLLFDSDMTELDEFEDSNSTMIASVHSMSPSEKETSLIDDESMENPGSTGTASFSNDFEKENIDSSEVPATSIGVNHSNNSQFRKAKLKKPYSKVADCSSGSYEPQTKIPKSIDEMQFVPVLSRKSEKKCYSMRPPSVDTVRGGVFLYILNTIC